MIVGIMQPYFFPYLGYFDHIFRCDKWVVLDLTQYTPQTWMNRNRLLHQSKDWEFITANVKKHHMTDRISDIRLASREDTARMLMNKTRHYRKNAPHYDDVMEIAREGFANASSDSLVDVNVSCLAAVCKFLDIPFEPIIASQAGFALPEIRHPGQWALEIATLMGADTYLNTPGGRELFVPQEFTERGIRLAFTRSPDFRYECNGYCFQPRLSILDVLFWNDKKTIKDQLGLLPMDHAN